MHIFYDGNGVNGGSAPFQENLSSEMTAPCEWLPRKTSAWNKKEQVEGRDKYGPPHLWAYALSHFCVSVTSKNIYEVKILKEK